MGGMLRRLEVQNLAVIREAALDFAPGLNVLTGETGAGKSLLVDALALLLGGRAEGLIGPYGESLLVTAFFEGPPGEAVLSRRVGARSTPRVDGEVVTLKELQAEAERRLSLHAQHTALALLSPRRQREALDALLPEGLLAAYQEAYARREALLKEKAALEESLKARAEREDLLRYQIREIEEARVRPGEEEELLALAERLRHLETIRERLARALALLTERETQDLLALAAKEVRAAARHDPALEALAEELSGAAEAVRAVARELEDHLEGLDLDPEELDRVEARLSLLERLKRKYGPTLADVLAHAQKAREELARMEGGEERLSEVERLLKALHEEVEARGQALRRAREEAARRLTEGMVRELPALGLAGARFAVVLEPLPEPGPQGLEAVAFRVAPNPNLPPAPLEALSGGELSRVALALALLTGTEAPTVVFDEVDAGVGGETAWRLAERLKRLAERRQVLVVTHLPQVAAVAQRHFRVTKTPEGVRVEPLAGEARVQEIARLLSGAYTQAALAHARELLEAQGAL
ncbi:AAA family ATPase [Thermus thermophilus]|uniref:DNA repair protein RecN n=1 Tax=Thermus thermophilus TaxID=274 RepID=UPI00333FF96C